MGLKNYCKLHGFGLSEINLYNILCFGGYNNYIINRDDFNELIPLSEKNKLGVVSERIILPGDKRIVFAKGWNNQCNGSALFLQQDCFYLAFDHHHDLYNHVEPFDCANYRHFVLDYLNEFFLINSDVLVSDLFVRLRRLVNGAGVTPGSFFDNYVVSHLSCVIESHVDVFLDDVKKHFSGKKGVICLDHDVLNRFINNEYGLDDNYSPKNSISFDSLKGILTTVMDSADIQTLFVTVPYEKKAFVEKLLD
ncbi:MAG: hypothetical protein WC307_04610 [Candidatus Nanoarchaeia archaeon]|jgi:hypothetical protein